MSYPTQPPSGPGPWGAPNQPQPDQTPSAWGQPMGGWNQQPGAWAPQPGQYQGDGAAQRGIPSAPRPGVPQQPIPGTQPLGVRQQSTVSIEQFKPPRNRTGPIALLVVAALVLGGILWFGTRPDPLGPGATPTPSRSATPRSTPSVATGDEFANSITFENDRVMGTFTINDSSWRSGDLVVDITISVDRGSISYVFMAMDMPSGNITRPNPPATGDLTDGTVYEGESVTGTLRFTKNRDDTQVLLADTSGRTLTMLAVKG